MYQRLFYWLLDGQPGLSSKAMVRSMLAGQAVDAHNHPRDAFDFRRCVLLLEQVPEARPALELLAGESRHWAALLTAWDEIETTLRNEWGRDLSDQGGFHRGTQRAIEALFKDIPRREISKETQSSCPTT